MRECLAQDDARHHQIRQQAATSSLPPPGVLQSPCLLYTGFDFIIKHGLDEEGIFRLAGSKNVVQKLIERANSVSLCLILLLTVKGCLLSIDTKEFAVCDAGDMLKTFFRELPDCLLCSSLFDQWLSVLP